MKKIIIFTAVFAVIAGLFTASHAVCVTKEEVIMYLDPYRAAAWMRIVPLSIDDATELMVRDTYEGSAMIIPKGTKIDWYEHFPKGITIVGINGVKLITATSIILVICR